MKLKCCCSRNIGSCSANIKINKLRGFTEELLSIECRNKYLSFVHLDKKETEKMVKFLLEWLSTPSSGSEPR